MRVELREETTVQAARVTIVRCEPEEPRLKVLWCNPIHHLDSAEGPIRCEGEQPGGADKSRIVVARGQRDGEAFQLLYNKLCVAREVATCREGNLAQRAVPEREPLVAVLAPVEDVRSDSRTRKNDAKIKNIHSNVMARRGH